MCHVQNGHRGDSILTGEDRSGLVRAGSNSMSSWQFHPEIDTVGCTAHRTTAGRCIQMK